MLSFSSVRYFEHLKYLMLLKMEANLNIACKDIFMPLLHLSTIRFILPLTQINTSAMKKRELTRRLGQYRNARIYSRVSLSTE